MFSVGTDLIEIDRIEKAMENPRFMQRVFGEAERMELEKRRFAPQSAAAAFAAKEAFSKAVGTGISGFSLCEVQLLHNQDGAPFLKLSGKALEKFGHWHFSVSLTHVKTLAQAVVIAQNPQEKEFE